MVSKVVNYSSLLGESPVWDSENQCLWWVDILLGDIHRYVPDNGVHTTHHFDHKIGAVALRTSGGLIAAIEDGIALVEPETGKLEYLVRAEQNQPNNRFNDGKCDAAGRFWAGTMDDVEGKFAAGKLYMLDENRQLISKISGVSCSNGLAWSLDNRTFYYIDSPTRQVVAYDYELRSGAIFNKRVVIQIPETDGLPDGMTIDSEGMLWIALWNGWQVARYDPHTGKKISEVRLPTSQISSCTFGGATLEDLYITTAKKGLSAEQLNKQPWAGCLFVLKNSGTKGFKTFCYTD